MANTTWNPSDKTAGITLSGTNNLVLTSTGASQGVRTIDRLAAGKYYFEYTCTTWSGSSTTVGVANGGATLSTFTSAGGGCLGGAAVFPNGGIVVNGTPFGAGNLGTRANGDVIGGALDFTNKLIWFRVAPSGNWNGVAAANPATGVSGASIASITLDSILLPLYGIFAGGSGGTVSITANFGDTAFTGAVPSGFTAGFPTGTPPLVAAATQTALEEWATTDAGTRLALATLVALEQWANVPTTGPLVVNRNTAVTVNTG